MKTQKGFTLIELLVVISIIALLLSILTPALSMAKEKARRLVCSANLKSMGTGLHFYTGDYDEKAIPMANLDGKETYDLDGKNILPWFGYVVGEDVDDPYLKAVNLGKLFSEQIVEVPDIFYCPTAAKSDEDDKYTHERCINRTGLGEIWAARGSRASVIFDLDNDGDLDVVTNEFNAEPMVLINDLAQVHDGLNFLKVKLAGSTSNRGGVGARVTVKAGDHSYTQVLDGKSGYLSQSLKPLYFGLAAMDQVDEIIVQWPSGTRQIVPGPKTNSLVEITESAN